MESGEKRGAQGRKSLKKGCREERRKEERKGARLREWERKEESVGGREDKKGVDGEWRNTLK